MYDAHILYISMKQNGKKKLSNYYSHSLLSLSDHNQIKYMLDVEKHTDVFALLRAHTKKKSFIDVKEVTQSHQ